MSPHTPRMSQDEQRRVEAWHERAYRELRDRTESRVEYLGLDLLVPPDVFPPTPVSDLFGRLVLDEVQADDRVLDMGTGSGSNALLAARVAHDVVAVDIHGSGGSWLSCRDACDPAGGGDLRHQRRPAAPAGPGRTVFDLLDDFDAEEIGQALLTCDDTNRASAAVIEDAGGVLQDVHVDGQVRKRRYLVPTTAP